MPGNLWLIRHGETEWSLTGQHTGRTNITLTARGRRQAAALGEFLSGREFALVLTSPLERALDTCRLAGYFDAAQVDPNLQEWDYGEYEGRATNDIHEDRPEWDLWTDGVPNGETIQQVAARASDVIDRVSLTDGDIALFAHGHILRILTAVWLGLPAREGRLFALSTATVSILGYERDTRVIRLWNQPPVFESST